VNVGSRGAEKASVKEIKEEKTPASEAMPSRGGKVGQNQKKWTVGAQQDQKERGGNSVRSNCRRRKGLGGSGQPVRREHDPVSANDEAAGKKKSLTIRGAKRPAAKMSHGRI